MKINIQDIYNKEVNAFVSGVHSSYPQFSMTIYDWMLFRKNMFLESKKVQLDSEVEGNLPF